MLYCNTQTLHQELKWIYFKSIESLHSNCVLSHISNVMVCTIHLKYYKIFQFNFWCFDLWRLAITTLDEQSCFNSNSYIGNPVTQLQNWIPRISEIQGILISNQLFYTTYICILMKQNILCIYWSNTRLVLIILIRNEHVGAAALPLYRPVSRSVYIHETPSLRKRAPEASSVYYYNIYYPLVPIQLVWRL